MTILQAIKSDVRRKYPDIYKINNNRLEKVNAKFSKINFWTILLIYTLLIAAVVFYSTFVNFDFLKLLSINFEDNIKSFSTSVITLVSMNLFVTNLLLTHLKEERDDLQTIIDKRVTFKFITYLGFTVIISILSLYFLSSSITSTDVKSNILVLIFFTFLFYIFQLINLYNSVFNFLNKTNRSKIIAAELDIEFSKAFYNNLLKFEFQKRYKEFYEETLKFKKYVAYSHSTLGLESVKLRSHRDLYLVDVKINSLKHVFNSLTVTDRYYVPLELDMKLEKSQEREILFLTKKIKNKFSNHYILKKKPCLQSELESDNINKLLRKISQNTLHNKFSDLKDNLDSLDNIYSKYMSLQKN